MKSAITISAFVALTQAVTPKVKGTPKLLGLVEDKSLNRDSCGSAKFGDRTIWMCRDTQNQNEDGSVQQFPVITSTASWSNTNPDGTPMLESMGLDPIHDEILQQYGTNREDNAYYPLQADECDPPAGGCSDGTRYAIWPDSPPMVTQTDFAGKTTAYTWIKKTHIHGDFSPVEKYPATTLYRVDYDPSVDGHGDKLPRVSVVDETFWQENEIPFGDDGNVVRDGVAYLYGKANGTIALAKVDANQVENKSAYQYYVDGQWTNSMPSIGQSGTNIPNAGGAGGQGTYYFSEPWNSYVWIGGGIFPGATFFVTTAPEPTGPWESAQSFYKGPEGNYSLSAYSLQANPALTNTPSNNSIFLTYTKNDVNQQNINVYTTPLIYVEWE